MIAQFPAFIDRRMDHKDYNGEIPSKYTKLGLQKLTDIHLHSHTDYEAEPNGDISRVYIFSVIALFILLIASINYMNLSTARSALRAREIGIRKVIGARKKEIILQFLSESVLITWAAILISFVLLYLTLPWLNNISGQFLSYFHFNEVAGSCTAFIDTLCGWYFIRFISRLIYVLFSTR